MKTLIMTGRRLVFGTMVSGVLIAGLAGCGDGASAVETRPRTEALSAVALTAGAPGEVGLSESATTAKPILTASRRETVDAKIQRLYERNGADFDAASPEAFLDKVTAFTTRPPAGVERVSRPNGDVLLYDAGSNTFAVVTRDGTPRTMFKPREGAAYWAEQKTAAPTFGQQRAAD